MPSIPLIVPEAGWASAAATPTLADYRAALGDQLGVFTRSVISSTVPGGEPGRWALVDDLADDDSAADRYAGGWLSLAASTLPAQQRRLRHEGFVGPFGALALARVVSDANGVPTDPRPGTAVELTLPLPSRRSGSVKGLDTLVNEALARLQVTARLPMVGDGTARYSLSSYPWLVSADQVGGLYDWSGTQPPGLGPPTRYGIDPTVRVDGASLSLEVPAVVAPGVPFEVAVVVPSDRLIFDGGAWGYAETGLSDDGMRAVPPVGQVVTVAMAKALEYLPRLLRQQVIAHELDPDEAAAYQTDVDRRLPYWRHAAAVVIERALVRFSRYREPSFRPALVVDRPSTFGARP